MINQHSGINFFKSLILCLMIVFVTEAKAQKSNDQLFDQIKEQVKEKFEYYGLASYYNDVSVYLFDETDLEKINTDEIQALKSNQGLAFAGRFNVLMATSGDAELATDPVDSNVEGAELLHYIDSSSQVISKPELFSIAPVLDQIRYAHLWAPFAYLAKAVEFTLIKIQSSLFSNWGLAIIFLSVLVKLVLLPISILTVQFQRQISQVQAKLAPKLSEIKAKYDGEDAHNRLMAAHKALGVSPFYTLKPMLSLLIQIPVLIAVFNALGEMPQLDKQSFLWISNLAYPDSIGKLPFRIPLFGSVISLLPVVMTLVALVSTYLFSNRYASVLEIKRQKCNLILMAAAFFILFYPFPAAMVLYWTVSNILHIAQQQFIKI